MSAKLPIRVLFVALLLSAAACSPIAQQAAPSESDPTPQAAPSPTASSSAPGASPTDTATPTQSGPADLGAVDLTLEPFVELDTPIAMATRQGDDALYFAERAGRVVRVVAGQPDADAVLDITSQTTEDSERGLLGITFSPEGDRLYVSSTNRDGDSQLDEYEMADTTALPDTRRNLLLVEQPFSNHNGGHVVTGPDGLLYYALGDGGDAGDPLGSGQDTSTLLGGLLRIDPAPSDGREYTIPTDNPFVDGGGRGELWVYGLRNPWRFSFDRDTGDLWLGDVGQSEREEINWLTFDAASGANLGWNVFEGTQRYSDGRAPNAVPPVFEYPHDGRCSVTGGYVYRGDAIPQLRGAYVFGDFCDGIVRALSVDGDSVVDDRAYDAQVPSLASFGQDAEGELYVLSLDGGVFRLSTR